MNIFALLCILVCVVSGDKNNNEDHKDFEDEHFEFSNFEIEQDKIKVESQSANYDIEYEIECEDTDPIISKLEYKSTNSSGFETETKSRVLIHGIQEWFDANSDSIMQDNEKIGSLYYVGENQYKDISYVGPDINNVYDFTIRENPNGYLTMISHITSNFTKYYDPNSMKFDIIIEDWVYQNNENQLALLVEYRTETETESDEDGYVSQKTSDPSLGYSALTWNTTIVYDNTNVGSVSTRMLNTTQLNELIQTDDEYEGEQTSGMWFCFDAKGASNIYWDPNIGVYTTPLSSSSSSSSSSSKSSFTKGEISGIAFASFIGFLLLFTVIYYFIEKHENVELIKNDEETHQLTQL
jgi:hypothetical protein